MLIRDDGSQDQATLLPKRVRAPLPVAPRQKKAAKPSLQVEAYERIKHSIITVQLRPGEYLKECLLSERLALGRTPVHQAINRLMLEGLVQVIPRKGIRVSPVSMEEILDIIEVRLLNETYCASLAAARADEHDIASMENILKRAEAASPTGDTALQMTLDREFHDALSMASKNQVIGELMRGLHTRSLRFWFLSLRSSEHHSAVQHEHREILDAIQRRNPQEAAEAVRRHIESFRRNLSKTV